MVALRVAAIQKLSGKLLNKS